MDNRKMCEGIAKDLEAYAKGGCKKCPECGETINRESWWDVGDKFKCPYCKEVIETDSLEDLSLWDYFDDCLDIEYRIGSDMKYRSVQIMVAWGGPSIYIDTQSKNVELYWWGKTAKYPIDYDTCDEIDSIFEEYYICSKS